MRASGARAVELVHPQAFFVYRHGNHPQPRQPDGGPRPAVAGIAPDGGIAQVLNTEHARAMAERTPDTTITCADVHATPRDALRYRAIVSRNGR